MKTALGGRIKELRTARGWSERKLGEKVGVSGAYIHQLEAGTRQRPNIELVSRLAEAFGLTVDELLTDGRVLRESSASSDGNSDPVAKFVHEIARQYEGSVDPETIAKAEDIVRGYYNLSEAAQQHVENQIALLLGVHGTPIKPRPLPPPEPPASSSDKAAKTGR